ncbi:sensor histidine kinase [Rhodohalobacter barkolensis]|uniref:histidine kinase n=1 Tax=Rhodohalobacter barkolensis TaxID=2053187 RepID=A0A2N0VFS3_9BACT|nr:HAMP domain-containing sensor histidine kinase [Rhodohalobacter barkolensis]PKD42998.1 sensor histidine kinase [Rhodohalobacter barkolensis]
MPFFNKMRKRNTVRWLFLSLGIVAVLALTVMNVYSLYALRESTIESAKDNKKSQLDEFTLQVRHQFGGPFRELRKLDIEKLENSWSVSGNFPTHFIEVLVMASEEPLYDDIYYNPSDSDACYDSDQPLYKFDADLKMFTLVQDVPDLVCDGFGISNSRVKALIDDYRFNNKVTFDAHRSMNLALINLEKRSVIGHLNFTINRDYLINEVIAKQLKEQFGPTDKTGIVVWLRDWIQDDILSSSDDQFTYNRDVHEIDMRQRFPEMLENWVLHASFLQSPTVAATNASLTRNLIVLVFAVVVLFGALVFMFINAQRERELAQRQAGFLANITHELKTPLAVMQAAGENISDGRVKDGERLKSYGEHIYNESVRLRKMIEKLLDVAKVDSGQSVVEQAPHQLHALVTDFVQSNKNYIQSKGFEINLNSDPNLPLVMIDPDHLETILNNLTENAIKYSSDKKQIDISLKEKNDFVEISVADQGDGIAKKSQRLIFEKFYRVENSLTAKTKGHGLGLAIVKNMVELNGGTIQVKSTEGKGSTFIVSFPALIKGQDDFDTSFSTGSVGDEIKNIDSKQYV